MTEKKPVEVKKDKVRIFRTHYSNLGYSDPEKGGGVHKTDQDFETIDDILLKICNGQLPNSVETSEYDDSTAETFEESDLMDALEEDLKNLPEGEQIKRMQKEMKNIEKVKKDMQDKIAESKEKQKELEKQTKLKEAEDLLKDRLKPSA